jgi:DNA adenine methylase
MNKKCIIILYHYYYYYMTTNKEVKPFEKKPTKKINKKKNIDSDSESLDEDIKKPTKKINKKKNINSDSLDEDIKKPTKKINKKKNIDSDSDSLDEDIKKLSKSLLAKDGGKNKIENYTKPVIKWVGGKTQIIHKIIESFPKLCDNYHEIFLGGGSVLIALLENIKMKNITITGNVYAYDFNETLINIYMNIQKKVDDVIVELKKYKDVYEKITGVEINRKANSLEEAKTSQESYYYYIRNKFNKMTQNEKNSPKGSALFIFINKTCFRGLYREGPNGINVPFGHYKTPNMYDEDHLIKISNLIKNVIFIHADFSESLKKPQKGDFVYMDPPYAPEKTDSFVGYTKDGFNINQHTLLFKKCDEMYKKNIYFVMSNSDVGLVKNSFDDKKKYSVSTILCKRNINAKNPTAKTNEILIKTINL